MRRPVLNALAMDFENALKRASLSPMCYVWLDLGENQTQKARETPSLIFHVAGN
jgi:hypothetical protein